MSIKNYLEKNKINKLLAYGFSTLIGPLTGLLTNPLLAQNLSNQDYALIGFFGSFQSLLVPLIGFNLSTYYIKNYHNKNKNEQAKLYNTIIFGQAIIGLISLCIFLTVFYINFNAEKNNFPFYPYAIYSYSQIYVNIFTTTYLNKLRLEGNSNSYALTSISFCLVSVGLTILMVVIYKQGASGKLIAALIASIITSSYGLYKSIETFVFDLNLLKDGLKFGFSLTISALFWYFITGIDKTLLLKLDDQNTYGLYIVASQIAGYMAIFYTAINNVIETDIFKSISENNLKHALRLISVCLIAVIFINILYITFAEHIIGLLTANRYTSASKFSRILALQNITIASYYLITKLFVGYGYLKSELTVRIIGSIFSTSLFIYLIDKYGFYGAAWAQVISFLIMTILGIIAFSLIYKQNEQK